VDTPADDRHARFGELIARYGALVRSAVAKVAGRADRDLGDEVLQRVSESLWRQVRSEREIRHPASYLYRCAVREAVRETLRRIDDGAGDAPDDQGPLDLAAAVGHPEAEASGRQLAGRVEGILASLPAERAAAARAHLAGFTVEELMHLRGWPYQKARNLIARGMADLRGRLAEEGLP
jgi:DNA-directed RNA polymerase specialized sigma24 family protein